MKTEHINELEIMKYLESFVKASHSSLMNTIFTRFSKKIKNNSTDPSSEHIFNCPQCMQQLWESYLSLMALQEINNTDNYIIQAKIAINNLHSSFKLNILDGLLLPIKVQSLNTVFSNLPILPKNEITEAKYSIFIPILKETIYLTLRLTNDDLSFLWEVDLINTPYTVSFYLKDTLIEKQTSNKNIKFLLNLKQAYTGTMVSFLMEMKDKPSIKIFQLQL